MVALPAFLRQHAYNPPDTKSETAFALANRVRPEEATFFDWLKTRPENALHFNTFMTSHRTGTRTWLDRPEVINEITDALDKVTAGKDGEGVSFVDIGGGIGHQCKVIRHLPGLRKMHTLTLKTGLQEARTKPEGHDRPRGSRRSDSDGRT